ncbi:MAG: serine/threonine protein kinase [Deltaproteobacteria bacterium]|nr:serine/threonine protein kinase [Deltaproteobacteria bacterium]
MSSDDPTLQLRFDPSGEASLVDTVVNGRYRVLELIATGGMGRIFRAEQIPLGRTVAFKVLHQRFTSGDDVEGFQKRFLMEASILSKLQHRNIVTVFDYGCIETSAPESYFMVMEFLAGETLFSRLARMGPMSPKDVIGLFRQLASGLRYAHAHDAIHRDLKPSNVMLVPQDDGGDLVKIVDFGLVKVLRDDSDQVTKEGTFLGSPRYMSPEQISRGEVDHRTDVYSLGVMLFQVLCGVVPFDSDQAIKTLVAHIHDPIPRMKACNPDIDVPAALEDFVRRCMEKDPSKRVQNMKQVFVELGEIGTSLGYGLGDNWGPDQDTAGGRLLVQPTQLVRPLQPAPDSRRDRGSSMPVVVGALALGLACAGFFGWRSLQAADGGPKASVSPPVASSAPPVAAASADVPVLPPSTPDPVREKPAASAQPVPAKSAPKRPPPPVPSAKKPGPDKPPDSDIRLQR